MNERKSYRFPCMACSNVRWCNWWEEQWNYFVIFSSSSSSSLVCACDAWHGWGSGNGNGVFLVVGLHTIQWRHYQIYCFMNSIGANNGSGAGAAAMCLSRRFADGNNFDFLFISTHNNHNGTIIITAIAAFIQFQFGCASNLFRFFGKR